MATLADLKPLKGARKKKKREARGHAGYGGKTAGKGMNGQKARKSAGVRKQFEGGQTPLYRRLPKHQYMPSFNKIEFNILNISDIEYLALEGITEITPEILLDKKVIKGLEKGGIKILAKGEISKSVNIKAHAFSANAEEKIKKAGGSIQKITE